MRAGLAVLVVLIMGLAVAGVGLGEASAERERAPSNAEVEAAEQRIVAGDATVARGRALFAAEGCDRCHSIAVVGAGGKLGPRLDRLDEDVDDILRSIVEPGDDTADGYPEQLMPTDYAQRMSDAEIQAVAAFVATVSGRERDDDDSGRGREGADDGSGRGRDRVAAELERAVAAPATSAASPARRAYTSPDVARLARPARP